MPIPVIDLFAGPGGLGEGFSALRRGGEPIFRIKLSIEKDAFAHRTLELRAFYRQFPDGEAPEEYYKHLRGEFPTPDLFARFPSQSEAAKQEAWHAELGNSKFPKTVIDARIKKALGNASDWVLIGGPPCQAYSLAGRARLIGESMERYETDDRHNLYRRYLRIIAVHEPPVFCMENVKGLLSARRYEKQIFAKILSDLEYPLKAECSTRGENDSRLHYHLFSLVGKQGSRPGPFAPEDFVVRMEDYGIPQARHRIIIIGIRSDVGRTPRDLQTCDRVTIDRALADLPPLRSGLSRESDNAEAWCWAVRETAYMPWVSNGEVTHEFRRKLREASSEVPNILTRGAEFIAGTPHPQFAYRWLHDPRLGGFCNHVTRQHIRQDLHRYLFAAAFARVYGRSPLLQEFPSDLLPKHHNVGDAINGGKFNDRFRVQVSGRPATTVVSHISRDGHYYIHYDPAQCRSLTVREAARLQTFPDNYFFEGPRTQQYHQVGNAVPPLVANKIADIVVDLIQPSCPNPIARA
jgi:DNA (cytosine-5)-methyltransferase 1